MEAVAVRGERERKIAHAALTLAQTQLKRSQRLASTGVDSKERRDQRAAQRDQRRLDTVEPVLDPALEDVYFHQVGEAAARSV